jgi:hypothetical protein
MQQVETNKQVEILADGVSMVFGKSCLVHPRRYPCYFSNVKAALFAQSVKLQTPRLGGMIVPPDEYLPKIRSICDKYNVRLIVDEIIYELRDGG